MSVGFILIRIAPFIWFVRFPTDFSLCRAELRTHSEPNSAESFCSLGITIKKKKQRETNVNRDEFILVKSLQLWEESVVETHRVSHLMIHSFTNYTNHKWILIRDFRFLVGYRLFSISAFYFLSKLKDKNGYLEDFFL